MLKILGLTENIHKKYKSIIRRKATKHGKIVSAKSKLNRI